MIDIYGDWKDIKGFEGYYQVNRVGVIRSVDRIVTFRDGRKRHYPEKYLPQSMNPNGYLQVILTVGHKAHTKYPHRLVAEAFIENPKNLKYVNHKDGNRENNIYTNLEWVSASQNSLHAYHVLNVTRPKSNGKPFPVIQIDSNGDIVKYNSVSEAHRKTGYSKSQIFRIADTDKETRTGLRFYIKNVEDIEKVSID